MISAGPLTVITLAAALAAAAALTIDARFDADLTEAARLASNGGVVIATRCGPIEYQSAGEGAPLLMIHGSGGGHDQGMAFAGDLARHGVRVVAMSRFGYLGTPMPADNSPAAQADAHACLLDALGIRRAAVMGASAGAPSATQMALRHPERVSALVLVVPIAWRPDDSDRSAEPLPAWVETLMLRALASDFLFWTALRLARDQVFRYVLATPPEQVAAASPPERARVGRIAERILPVSVRAGGLREDSALGRRLRPYPLEAIRAPTLVISARDDGYGTYASARYTASRIPGARFVGFDTGGHVLVGHDEAVRAEILALLQGTRGAGR